VVVVAAAVFAEVAVADIFVVVVEADRRLCRKRKTKKVVAVTKKAVTFDVARGRFAAVTDVAAVVVVIVEAILVDEDVVVEAR